MIRTLLGAKIHGCICTDVDLDWDINRVVKNFQTLNVIIYQELTTDIRGNPN